VSPVATSYFPTYEPIAVESILANCVRLAKDRSRTPFDPETLAFAAEFSKALLSDRAAARFPQVVSLGYWLRATAIERLRLAYEPLFAQADRLVVPRGLVFHLPPANVDTLFLYSWIMGMLAGNTNVIRLPSALNDVTQLLLGFLRATATPAIAESNLFVAYGRDDVITAEISQVCDVRVVWGGDEKVSAVRTIPLPPNAIDLNFANRFSIAAIKASAFEALDEAGEHQLTERVYNDVFWFNQMGCGSPRVLYWVGEACDFKAARRRFFESLSAVEQEKGYFADVGAAVAKTNFAFRAMLDHNVASYERFGRAISVLTLAEPEDVRGEVQGGGLLWEARVASLFDLAPALQRSDQTLTYFGFDRAELLAFARAANGRGIDRIVPAGAALDFGHLWDGYDLVQAFTRVVHIA